MIEGLGKPENRHVLLQLRTARAWGVPLSVLRTEWKPKDRQAALALMEFEDSLHTCGQPKAKAFDQSMSGWFEVDDTLTCHACAALDEFRKNHDPRPGEVLFIKDTTPDDPTP